MRCLLVAAALAAGSARAYAGNPLDKPAFTATPKELLDAAKGAPPEDIALLDDIDASFDDGGKLTKRLHYIVLVNTPTGVAEWGHERFVFAPWREGKPSVRSRVIEASGDVHELDPSTLVDEADPIGDTHYLRGRIVVHPGSVVEEETTLVDTAAVPGGRGIVLPLSFPVAGRTIRLTISAPTALHAKVIARALPKTATVRHTTTGKRETWSYVLTNVAGEKRADDVPLDVFAQPQVAVTLAHGWSDLAKAYDALAEPKLTMALPPEVHAGDSLEVARAVTTWVHEHVTYAGVHLGLTALDAANPEQAVKRGTGSADELAMIETALLRAAGIKAELVLVDRGPHRGGDPDAPNLDDFDQVLVRATIRGVETWIDPEDPDLPVGELRVDDQGRTGLAITRGVRIETPRAPASANTLRETRTYQLAEIGYGTVTEMLDETGELARQWRGWVHKAGDAQVRKKLTDDVARRYDGELTSFTAAAVDDLAKPTTTTLAIGSSSRVQTMWDQITIDLFPREACEELPLALRDAHASDRRFDLAIPKPFVVELTTRIVVPAGFALPAAQPEHKRPLGALVLVETQHVDGRTFAVTYRLEVGKTRLTATEANETRKAVVALAQAPEHFTFAHEAWALADQGKYHEAVAKMVALIDVHPRDAIDHARFAELLIRLGDGEGARREASKAVELAPQEAEAHLALGWVLTHDLAGRKWAVGFDRDGARKELELARSISPKHAGAVAELASLLERGTRGRLLGNGSEPKAAAEAWGVAYVLDPSQEDGEGLLRTLLWSGDYGGVETVAADMKASQPRDAMLLVANALAHGPDAALRDLATTTDRDKVVAEASSLLTVLRRYDVAKQLLAKAGISGAAAQLAFTEKLSRFDAPAKPTATPETVVFEFLGDQLEPGTASAIYWDSDTMKDARESFHGLPTPPDGLMMTIPALLDIAHSLAKVSVDGDANAWRVALEAPTHKDAMYLAAERGVPKIIGYPRALAGVGRHVLRLMGKHDDAARRLLDWVASDLPRHELRYVWSDTLPKDTVHMTVAAALLARDPDRDIDAGTSCGMTTVEGQNVCDQIAVRGFTARAKWTELEAYTATWAARAPAAYVIDALAGRALALSELGRFDEAAKIVDDALAAHPDNARMLFMRMNLAAFRGQRDEIVKSADAAAAQTQSAIVLNNIAWVEYLENVDPPGALARARKSFAMDRKSGFTANTLSALEEANGDLKDALEHARMSLDLERKEAPADSDWFVLGRIYEDSGLRDDAIAAYRRIAAPKVPDLLPTPYSLAAARLKILGAPKK